MPLPAHLGCGLDFGTINEAVGAGPMCKGTTSLVCVCVVKVVINFSAKLAPPAFLPMVRDEVGVVAAARPVLSKFLVRLKYGIAVLTGAAG